MHCLLWDGYSYSCYGRLIAVKALLFHGHSPEKRASIKRRRHSELRQNVCGLVSNPNNQQIIQTVLSSSGKAMIQPTTYPNNQVALQASCPNLRPSRQQALARLRPSPTNPRSVVWGPRAAICSRFCFMYREEILVQPWIGKRTDPKMTQSLTPVLGVQRCILWVV